jgi:ABC-type amino acid transport substrate-binding protein
MKSPILAALWLATTALACGLTPAHAASPGEECDVPQSYVETDLDLSRVLAEVKDKHRLDISVIGTGSSALSGAEGSRFAYPSQLSDLLKAQMSGVEIKVTAHTQSREVTSAMVSGMDKILGDDKPALVIWQTGTADAMNGVEPDEFRTSLDEGVQKIQAAQADAILMNMQYSPRTESMLDVSAYADVMRVVAQQHDTPLFDRLALMHYWNDQGTFDLYTPTKKYDIARRVHECIGRALASLIINAAHLDAVRKQTTR